MQESEITISIGGGISLKGNLCIPDGAQAFVVFSHGSGSSRFSPRNRHVAEILNKERMATLLADLLTPEEDAVYANRFNIDLLTNRLMVVTEFVRDFPELKNQSTGYFGASTGAASALQAAGMSGNKIQAVVSRGGRPDLAKNPDRVTAPTLLIVGSLDTDVIQLNRHAYALLGGEKKIEIVENASHLFEEKGKLGEVAMLATNWFKRYLFNPH